MAEWHKRHSNGPSAAATAKDRTDRTRSAHTTGSSLKLPAPTRPPNSPRSCGKYNGQTRHGLNGQPSHLRPRMRVHRKRRRRGPLELELFDEPRRASTGERGACTRPCRSRLQLYLQTGDMNGAVVHQDPLAPALVFHLMSPPPVASNEVPADRLSPFS